MTANVLTKALGWEKLERFRRKMGVEGERRKNDAVHLIEWEC
jgi:hypothetical protein